MNFNEELRDRVRTAEEMVIKYGVSAEEGYQKTVLSAMNYSLLSGGKRLRPVMMREACTLFGGEHPCLGAFMAALEMIHTYSLVHDDLPAMDNDEYRRGKKTTHIVYGEDMAILTGDALLNKAYETVAHSLDLCADDPELTKRALTALKILTHKSGIYGMVGGQVYDVEAEDNNITLSEDSILFIFRLKTGALIQAALTIGAVLGGATQEEVDVMELVGEAVGIAFQIKDDILDVTGNPKILGKPVGSDEKNHKTTYVTIKGLKVASEDVNSYSNRAVELLGTLDKKNEFLEELIKFLINRDR
ncbi:MAG: polyprenyl synthetase family protein [Lachnospiraceae bacterium]|nr:polyprenyl synthetase family protein [Lachnospiraceae bacterium]MBR5766999.1 polyprenyl synthetase family protein [Lachnospiraceae bacterium]MBR6485915.1 polyprenyl synthetase family protein [Lachnospiraceae bacterium]